MKTSTCGRWYLRLIVLLVLFFPLTLSAAQGRVAVKGQSITLKQAIKIIEANSKFKFFFNPSDLDALPGRDLDCEGEIANSGITYVIMENDIILKLEKNKAGSQQKKVEIIGGVVDGRTGESVVGATVQVKGAASGVITDINGKFTIKAAPGDVLAISYIGYETKEVKVVSGKVLVVELVEDTKQLEEVVVTAYGSGQKKGRFRAGDTSCGTASAFGFSFQFICRTFGGCDCGSAFRTAGSRWFRFLYPWYFYNEWSYQSADYPGWGGNLFG